MARSVRRSAIVTLAVLATTGCMTGERPSFAEDTAAGPVGDPAVAAVLDLLESGDDRPVEIRYELLRKFGNTRVEVVLARDRDRWSLTVGEVRFLDIGGRRTTCDLPTGRCDTGFDEARASDALTTVRFSREAAARRLRRDARTATGAGESLTIDAPGGKATCVLLPQPGGESFYCADDRGLIVVQDTADVRVERARVDEIVDPTLFETTAPTP